ncbi:MAG TPA: hypothetical protein VMA31_02620 [Bryobacteraceae bacterium]|nr:hypothetical protein [Bryobacteraceae bacterium]
MKRFLCAVLPCLLAATGSAYAQLASTAYRVLGQVDFQSDGVNQVQGTALHSPAGIALDSRGGQLHLYICDSANSRVLAWANIASYSIGNPPDLVLGQSSSGSSGAYGIGAKGFNVPSAIAVDPTTGNLFVADTFNNRVLRFPSPFANPSRIEPDAVYGQPNFSTFTAGSSATLLNDPHGVAVDSGGNLWVSDSANHRILRFAAAGLDNTTPPAADTVIGQPDFVSNASNRGGSPSASSLYDPAGLAFDAQGNLYVADFGNTRVLRYPAPAGGVTNLAANAVWGETNFTTRGVPAQASGGTMAGPIAVAVDGSGTLYVATPQDNRVLVFPSSASGGGSANFVFGQTDFVTTTVNTGAFPSASPSTLYAPYDVKVDANGNVYVADTSNNRVLQFTPGTKSAALVWGQTSFTGNGPNQIKPGSIAAPYKMVIDYSQTPYALYVSDTNNNRVLVWKDSTAFRNGDPADFVIGQPTLYTAAPNIDTQAAATPSSTSLSGPAGLALNPYSGDLYVADSGNNRVLHYPRPVAQTGRITPDAVIGQVDFTTSTSAAVTASSLNNPTGLAFASSGDLFVADTGNNRVLEFPSGAGTGASAIRVYGQPNMNSSVKSTQATAQTLTAPHGLYIDSAANLYVVDSGNGRVAVFAYTVNAPPSGALAAYVVGTGSLQSPVDVSLDSSGNIYVSDISTNRVVIFSSPISLAGPTLLGVVGQSNSSGTSANWDASNGQASGDSLYAPLGVYVDRQDTLYVGDSGNSRVLQFLKAVTALNAASYVSGLSVAQGGLATLTGTALASTTAYSSLNAAWPSFLADRTVEINDQLPAPLSLVSPSQVNFQVPSSAPLGTQRVAIRTADTNELVAGGNIPIGPVSPGLFTVAQSGAGQGLILNQDGSANSASNPAAAGSTITLYGTGQGQVSPAVSDGVPAPGPGLAATVAVPTSNGQTCLTVQPSMCVAIGSGFGTVQQSGLAPGYVGLWQINVTIPTGTASGGAVPLRVVIDGSPSNIVTVAVK